MSKSTIIIVIAFWLMCAMYMTLARIYNLPYANQAMIGSWIASAVLLVCIIIFIRKHKSK